MKPMMYLILIALAILPVFAFAMSEEEAKIYENLGNPGEEIKLKEQELLKQREANKENVQPEPIPQPVEEPMAGAVLPEFRDTRDVVTTYFPPEYGWILSACYPYGYYSTQLGA